MKRFFTILFLIFLISSIFSQDEVPIPGISIQVTPTQQPRDLVATLEILLILTVLTLAPSILILFTSFTRIIIVFSFTRNALGTRQVPPNQVLIGLALILTFFIMQPTWNEINTNALTPYMDGKITYQEFFSRTMASVRKFMINELVNHHNEDNVFTIANALKQNVTKIEEAPDSLLTAAFVLGEVEIGFKMGILIYIPFIVIDMVVASILLSLGMIMIPPVLVSLPFKVLVFVLANGWESIIVSLVKSFAY
ncbi:MULTISPECIES: flagellar type III secretion system pore protein FliP [Fervidobacterium]|uniref:Flagellar biosynthetic protein FliP n=1 Tax=Fervidobacterium nodosum (strain ATCC 35602 / DSM 5306 / Rt17-B1) TaxID=381764 RepID=A7HKW6_FERNB|nr:MULTISPECIES: flagellar type III secretion system pore protein FliP [Fervidobacterium]ABS60549.1 flagellar biosynthetic protein FliP [Fervidobacterium nodosum Rt17-B1]KAF2962489.1 flagellar biosynthesis protein flip [Fervidobacterium sp. 2310opik-2]PHJ14105.1 flagellar biosynthesis protein flip [Fervidobacterium sp. SC_NGM5_G05]